MTDPAPPVAGARQSVWRHVLVACSIAVALRIAFGLTSARYAGGDQWWYLKSGDYIREGGWIVPYSCATIRPPGFPYLVAVIDAFAGSHTAAALRVVMALLFGVACAGGAAVAQRLVPGRRWVPIAAAWILALDPVSIEGANHIQAENAALPLFLWGLAATIDMVRSPSRAAGLRVGAYIAAGLLFRPDVVVEAAMMAAWVGVAILRTPETRRRLVAACAVATATIVIPTVGWWTAVSAVPGPVPRWMQEVTDYGAERYGTWSWTRTVDLDRQDLSPIVWVGPAGLPAGGLPDSVFDNEDEARQVRAAFALDWNDVEEHRRAQEILRTEGDARWERDPLRAVVWLPLKRTANLWFDADDRDAPRSYPRPSTTAARLFRSAMIVARYAAGAAAALSIGFLLRPSRPTALFATIAPWRMFVSLWVMPVVLNSFAWESRRIYVPHVVAMILIPVIAAAIVRPPTQRSL